MNRWIINLLGILVLALAGIGIYIHVVTDNDAPKITIPNTTITYKEGEDTEMLLRDVTAVDEVDGDVTDSLAVASIYETLDKSQARVVYIARDKSNNMATAERYVDYVEQSTGRTDAEVTPEPSDEETSKQSKNEDLPVPGTPEEELAAAQEAAAQAFEQLPAGAPRLTLTATKVAVKAGSEFLLLQYVHDITDDKDTKDDLYKRIQVSGEVNATVPGAYEMIYQVKDSDGNLSNQATLTVVVTP